MKRKVQAQRKFAQGAPIPPSNANNPERKVEVAPNREEPRNVVRNKTSAKALLDIISFQQLHIHKTPVVVLERLRTDALNQYPIIRNGEPDEQLEPTSGDDLNRNANVVEVCNNLDRNLLDPVAGDNASTSICDSTATTSGRNTMLLRSRTRSNKKSEEVDMLEFFDPDDHTMIPDYSQRSSKSEDSSNEIRLESGTDYEEKEDNISDSMSEVYDEPEIITITSTQHSDSCNMSDISLDEDKPLSQYVRKKELSTTKQLVASDKKKDNKKPTSTVPSRRLKKKLTDAHKRTQNMTCPKKSNISSAEEMLDSTSESESQSYSQTDSESDDEEYAALPTINIESTNDCDSSVEDVAMNVPLRKRKNTNNDPENIYHDNDYEYPLQTRVNKEERGQETRANLTRLPKTTECNITETIEILDDDDDDVIIIPSCDSESTRIKQPRKCPIQEMKYFSDIIGAPEENLSYRCCVCNACVQYEKLIEIRLLVNISKHANPTTVVSLQSLENESFVDTTIWTDQLTLDLDISKQYNLRLCYCKHVKVRRRKPLLICQLIKKPIAETPPQISIEAQYARIILEYLNKHFSFYSKEKESVQFETENESVCITKNKIAFFDKTPNTDYCDMKVIGSNRSPGGHRAVKKRKFVKRQSHSLVSEPVSLDSQDSSFGGGNLCQSSKAHDTHQVNPENIGFITEQIKRKFISGLKALNPSLSTPLDDDSESDIPCGQVAPDTQEYYDQQSIQFPSISSRVSLNQDTVNQPRLLDDIDIRQQLSPSSTTLSASQTDMRSDDFPLTQQLASANKSNEPQRHMSPKNVSNTEYLQMNTLLTSGKVSEFAQRKDRYSCDSDGTFITVDDSIVVKCQDINNFAIIRDNVKPSTSMAHTFNSNARDMTSPNIANASTSMDDREILSISEISSSSATNEQHYPYSLFTNTQKIRPTNIKELQPNPGQSFINAPVFEPTAEEFLDPVAYFDSIMPIASKYGICKIIPPKEFAPSCTLNDDMMFNVTNQYVTRLFSRWGPGSREMSTIKAYLASQSVVFKRAPLYEGMEVNLPKLYQIVQRHGGLKKVIERKRWGRVAEEIRFTKGPNPEKKLDQFYVKYLLPYDTLSPSERSQIMSRVERAWCEKYRKMTERAFQPLDRQHKLLVGSDSSEEERSDGSEDDPFITGALLEAEECVMQGRKMNLTTFKKVASNALEAFFPNIAKPLTSNVEEEYWRLVLLGSEHLCVISASVDTGTAGYGFPINDDDPYGKHTWNLKNMAKNNNNILRYLGPVLGVTLPTLHLGMVFSTSCWHRDPHGLPWMEYMHSGPTKIWYGIPDEQSDRFRKAVESLCPTSCQNKSIWLPSDIAMIPPNLLQEQNVTLSRVEQNPGEYVIIFPKAYSCSISTGYTVSESVYFALKSWLLSALQFFTEAQISCEPTMISIESLLLSIVKDNRTPLSVLQPALTVLNQLLEYERSKRYALEDDLQMFKASIKHLSHMSDVWNVREQEECEFCRKSLFLSRVRGLTVNNTSVCLEHAVALIDVRMAKNLPTAPFEVHYFISTAELTNVMKAAGTRLCKIT